MISHVRIATALVALVSVVQPQLHAQPAAKASAAMLASRFDSIVVDAFMRRVRVSSVSAAVVRGDDTLLFKAYGLADREANRAATPRTVYEIGSVTKQFTASAIMRLVEQGKLKLDDDIGQYVPRFPLQGHRVTIRNLLNHTSGIRNYTATPAWRPHWADDLPPDSIPGFVANDKFDFEPGTKFAYSNTGYHLLGLIIEKVTGTRYANYVSQQFFSPFGLTQTRYCDSHPTDPRMARGYSEKDSVLAVAPYLSMTIPYAAGALCSTVGDFIAWERAFHSGRVVSAASYREMTTPPALPGGAPSSYGFGLAIGTLAGHRAITHSGGIPGFTTVQLYLPDDSVQVVVFTNSDEVGPEPVAFDLARVVIGVAPTGRGAMDRPRAP
jgi:CubicO group peptidase (beta-lactamase class C family)